MPNHKQYNKIMVIIGVAIGIYLPSMFVISRFNINYDCHHVLVNIHLTTWNTERAETVKRTVLVVQQH